ncbi:hypothetical protein NLI96_g9642 [Meripilus lineatus]|uniref:DNA 3'-5' helicase n=1 Tax=Meripilus lineatus TaxID=2056292 RepID=A0AAD5YF10_9APHY|nr:hypothetical protein NLI96_g9642 [Physisporinus lineatus]
MRASFTDGLNPAQLQAVTHDPKIPLQILAGPGSGKTKVLTSRIAYLISHHRIRPSSICAVTFTNKAANEMRERLTKLIGKEKTEAIKLGTFHALCARFLRKHYKVVGLEGNFTVCDSDESKKIVKKLLGPYKKQLEDLEVSLQEGTVLSRISKAKAKGLRPADVLSAVKVPKKGSVKGTERAMEENRYDFIERVVAEIYRDYQKQLTRNNSLDFDDLLVFGVRLLKDNSKVGKWCKHVLVDEFQDTNTMQYELMVYIAKAQRCVTIVGDPDQSIYGWRSAEVRNLKNMIRGYHRSPDTTSIADMHLILDFPGTEQILLEQNYRSTGSILAASVAIVSQDRSRIPKTLRSTHQTGPRPFLRVIPMDESRFVAAEIKRLIAYSGGMLTWNDFVILLRYNSLSRQFEKAFMNETIPYRVLAGQRFFERAEVKDILAYLQIIDNPQYLPAFSRCINVPSRTIGEKSVSEILMKAAKMNMSPMEALERICDGKTPDIKPAVKRKAAPFIKAIRELRKLAIDGSLPAVLIGRLVELIEYRDYLTKTQPDADSRWDNVEELMNFAAECDASVRTSERPALSVKKPDDDTEWIDGMEEVDQDLVDDESDGLAETPLRAFLQATTLSTDTEGQDGDKKKEAVIISTCHAAKGLEWPVVFIPAVEKGVFPSARAEDVEEERRLLYVACTRAQGLLYLTHSQNRMVAGEVKASEASEFVTKINNDTVFTSELPGLDRREMSVLATVWQRSLPKEGEVKRRVEIYNRDCNHPLWQDNRPPRSHGHYSHATGNPKSSGYEVPTTISTGFTSARASLQQQLGKPPGGEKQPSRAPLSPSKTTILNTTVTSSKTSGFGKPNSWAAHSGNGRNGTASTSRGRSNSQNTGILGSQSTPILIEEFSSPPPIESSQLSRRYGTTPLAKDPPTEDANMASLTGLSSSSTPTSSARRISNKPSGKGKSGRPGPSSPIKSYFSKIPGTISPPRSTTRTMGSNAANASLDARNPTSLQPNTRRTPSNEKPNHTGTARSVPGFKSAMGPSDDQRLLPNSSTSVGNAFSVPQLIGKRRLGMGRTTGGYPNKKFKAPIS